MERRGCFQDLGLQWKHIMAPSLDEPIINPGHRVAQGIQAGRARFKTHGTGEFVICIDIWDSTSQ